METTEVQYHDAQGNPVDAADPAGVIEIIDEGDGAPIFSISLPNVPD